MISCAKPVKRLRRRTIVILIVAAIILAWLGLLARDVLVLRDDVQALQDYFSTLPGPIDPQKIDVPLIQQRMAALHGNLLALHSHAGPLLAISPAFGWLPSIGGEVRSAPALFDMALELADIADNALKTIAPYWPPATNGKLSLETLAQLSQQMQPGLPALQDGFERVAAIRPRIDASSLSARTRSLLDRFDAAFPLARTGLGLLTVAPQLLGVDRPRTYLVMLQNEDELRPTGGFISAAARITLDAGRIVTMTVIDGNLVDDFTNKPYDEYPPDPLLNYMGLEYWLFRDANWSPDFPTSARKAASLYTYGQNIDIDGVVALNQRVVKSIVAAMEPIPISADAPPLTVDNIDDYLRLAWAPPADPALLPSWFPHRKEFIGQVSQAILQHLLQSPGEVNWPTLMRGLIERLNSHDLLFTMLDPILDKPLVDSTWNGALQSTAGDYLMVVDSNLGYNKVNAVITQSLAYSVTLQTDGQIEASANLTYQNNNTPQPGCDHFPSYDSQLTYALLINRCYWDYMRMLVPAGAQLISASKYPVPAAYLVTHRATDGSLDITTELSKTVFGTLFVVERGQSLQMSLSYILPANAIAQEGNQTLYRLLLQKQPGASDRPIHFTLNWPNRLRFASAQPAPGLIGDHFITMDLPFNIDQRIEVRLVAEPH